MTGVLPALPAQRRDRRRIRAFARLTAGQCPLPGEGRRAGRLSDGSWYLNNYKKHKLGLQRFFIMAPVKPGSRSGGDREKE